MSVDLESLRKLEEAARGTLERAREFLKEAEWRALNEGNFDEVQQAEIDIKRAQRNIEVAERALRMATTKRELVELRASRGPPDPDHSRDRDR